MNCVTCGQPFLIGGEHNPFCSAADEDDAHVVVCYECGGIYDLDMEQSCDCAGDRPGIDFDFLPPGNSIRENYLRAQGWLNGRG